MTNERTAMTGSNQTPTDLRESPHADYVVMEPGTDIMDRKGAHVYLALKGIESSRRRSTATCTSSGRFRGCRGSMIQTLVTSEIVEVRSIVDTGRAGNGGFGSEAVPPGAATASIPAERPERRRNRGCGADAPSRRWGRPLARPPGRSVASLNRDIRRFRKSCAAPFNCG
jgi:hypothetical protein